jgi:hypothetical protein
MAISDYIAYGMCFPCFMAENPLDPQYSQRIDALRALFGKIDALRPRQANDNQPGNGLGKG